MRREGERDASDLVELPPGVKRLASRDDGTKASRRTLSDALRDAERARLARQREIASPDQP